MHLARWSGGPSASALHTYRGTLMASSTCWTGSDSPISRQLLPLSLGSPGSSWLQG